MSVKVNIFNFAGQQTGTEEFPNEDEAQKFTLHYGKTNSGFATIDTPVAQASEPVGMQATPEVTPQDLGEPSPVPYSIFLQKPSPDIDPKGQTIIRMNLALKTLAECGTRNLVPPEVMPFITMADKAFRNGYYRFELIVGDWSIKIYKHPNNR